MDCMSSNWDNNCTIIWIIGFINVLVHWFFFKPFTHLLSILQAIGLSTNESYRGPTENTSIINIMSLSKRKKIYHRIIYIAQQ